MPFQWEFQATVSHQIPDLMALIKISSGNCLWLHISYWRDSGKKIPFHFIIIFVKMTPTSIIIWLPLFIALACGAFPNEYNHPVSFNFFWNIWFFNLNCIVKVYHRGQHIKHWHTFWDCIITLNRACSKMYHFFN